MTCQSFPGALLDKALLSDHLTVTNQEAVCGLCVRVHSIIPSFHQFCLLYSGTESESSLVFGQTLQIEFLLLFIWVHLICLSPCNQSSEYF